jgi:hypothetical protein
MSAESARLHRWQTLPVEPKPRQPLTAAQIRLLELMLAQENEDRQKGKQRLKQATQEARAVPQRPKQPASVICPTCSDHQTVSRIRGGVTFGQPCPDCNGGTW